MDILSKNAKTGYSVNLPAPSTCRKDCPLRGSCYAQKGRFLFTNVKRANDARLALYQTNPHQYFERLAAEIRRRRITHLRVFGSGDCPSREYAHKLTLLASVMPDVWFWVATRKPYMFNLELPRNMVVRTSMGVRPVPRAGFTVSSVSSDRNLATCPATLNLVKDCRECGYLCWGRENPAVVYLKH